MINQKHCPFCKAPAATGCKHLAVAVEGRDFVRRCVELCQGEKQWRALSEQRRRQQVATGEWSPEQEDYTWLETAFCEEFLRRLSWFGGMEHEWRAGPGTNQAGFLVLLWSKDPRQLWWQLRDELERQAQEHWSKPGKGRKPRAQSPRSDRRNGDSLPL
ncbi:MAG TPA: hypothetical protein PKI20_09640 [Verrucomicrobiota bacterium]|nr:hypothetical protein [Verrucomicrobiota bacterium]HQL77949.1 hypothetical protein [Verrucomicrobiota bacterium]